MPVPAAAILFDGWSLVHHPNSYEALHLLEILHSFPLEFQPILALPGDTIHPLPERIEIIDDLHAASDPEPLEVGTEQAGKVIVPDKCAAPAPDQLNASVVCQDSGDHQPCGDSANACINTGSIGRQAGKEGGRFF